MSGLLFEYDESVVAGLRIVVVGVGGAGGNALDRMVQAGISGVEFAAVNTDVQALNCSAAPVRIQIGKTVTKGLGAGADPERALAAVQEDRAEIEGLLRDTDMAFITAGEGGGTGSGAAPEIARMAREAGALTVGVVTRPFNFEGRPRMRRAEEGIARLKENVDTLILVPNQRLLSVVDQNTHLRDAFRIADEVLMSAVRGISDLITVPGLINLDFADVQAVMSVKGDALMGVGSGSGEYAAIEAAERAISCPLLDEYSIEGAASLLVNITGGEDMTLSDVNDASTVILEAVGEDAEVFLGAVTDSGAAGEIRVTVIATGISMEPELKLVDASRMQKLKAHSGSGAKAAGSALSSGVSRNSHVRHGRGGIGRAGDSGGAKNRSARDRSLKGANLVIDWDGGESPDESALVRQDQRSRTHPFVPPEPEEQPQLRQYRKKATGELQNEDLETPTFLRRTMD